MGHITSKDAYKSLEERINWFTQGAPPTSTLYKILQVLYTEKEDKRVNQWLPQIIYLIFLRNVWDVVYVKPYVQS